MLPPMTQLDLDLTPFVEDHAGSNLSPSGIVAVAERGALVSSLAWGDDGYGESTKFRVASCTKSFTALALLALRRAGKLTLDDEVRAHLPELTLEAPAGWPTLRIRHLLSMSGGLATDNPWGDRQEAASRERLGAWMSAGVRLLFPPGSAYEYSNLGYALLGEIVTRAAGRPYRDYIMSEIVVPLGLSDTAFSAADLDGVVQGYHREPPLPGRPGGWTPQPQSAPGAFSPMGGLYSSVRDLARWADLHLGREAPEGAAFTSADLVEAQEPLCLIAASHAEAPLCGTVVTGYGYGLKVERFERHGTLVSHAGGYPGFTAYMCWHRPTGRTVIASANGTHSAAPTLARKVMFELMAGANGAPTEARPWPETVAAVSAIDALVAGAGEGDARQLAARHAELFADNVELDFPLVDRIDHLRRALVNLGRVDAAGPHAPPRFERPCRASWQVRADHGRLELFLELAPVAPFKVQTFSAVAVNGPGRVTLF